MRALRFLLFRSLFVNNSVRPSVVMVTVAEPLVVTATSGANVTRRSSATEGGEGSSEGNTLLQRLPADEKPRFPFRGAGFVERLGSGALWGSEPC